MKRSPTKYVVGGVIGAAMLLFAFTVAGWKAGLGLSALLVYEAWTFINKYKNDTISEIIWEFAERPMVPWVFGVACGWAVASETVSDPYLIGAIFFLMGHFFFQRQRKNKYLPDDYGKRLEEK